AGRRPTVSSGPPRAPFLRRERKLRLRGTSAVAGVVGYADADSVGASHSAEVGRREGVAPSRRPGSCEEDLRGTRERRSVPVPARAPAERDLHLVDARTGAIACGPAHAGRDDAAG